MFNGKHKGPYRGGGRCARTGQSWALATLKIPTNEITPATLAKARPVLARWLPQIKVFDSDSPKTALLAGDVDLGIVWSGEGAILYRQDPKKFRWLLPAEGSHRFIDNLAIPKTVSATRPTPRRSWISCCGPEVSKLISDAFPYTNPNLAACGLLTDAQRANPASYPPRRGGEGTWRRSATSARSRARWTRWSPS